MTVLLDISQTRERKRLTVYMDGVDARVFQALKLNLGSEERAKNAILLIGLLVKLDRNKNAESGKRSKKIMRSFGDIVGISFGNFEEMLDSI
ncbi:MAG: hypothetical protein JRN52_12880 [Nitrososphaerota archaeon]|nr:hypothetical protein [Nitrososphaerota archaeon]